MSEEGKTATDGIEEGSNGTLMQQIANEIIYSPLNLILIAIITFLIYQIFKTRHPKPSPPPEPEMPKLRRDFTVQELKAYDGNQPDGRVLVAVNGNVYDVTKGKRFYGPEYRGGGGPSDQMNEKIMREARGPYAAFGGRDASRGLATFSVTANDNLEYDDLSDLSPHEMESVREWEMQFKEKYDLVGKLLKPGEKPTSYSDEEDEPGSSDKSGGEEKVDEKTEDDTKPEE